MEPRNNKLHLNKFAFIVCRVQYLNNKIFCYADSIAMKLEQTSASLLSREYSLSLSGEEHDKLFLDIYKSHIENDNANSCSSSICVSYKK